MRAHGITYDTGFRSAGTTTREPFDPQIVKREMQIIREDLHCTAVRVTGGHPDRLETAARLAAEAGLEVWISPFTNELGPDELLELLAACADRAERLRKSGAEVVMVAGAELSLFAPGFLPGETAIARVNGLLTDPNRRDTVIDMRVRINEFLGRAVSLIRQRFGGKITYASIPLEWVDWRPFDIVSLDCYRTREIAGQFRGAIATIVAQGKPVAITEFGCATFRGAGDRGARGGAIVEYEDGKEKQLDGDYARDEHEQAREIVDLLNIFREEGVDTVFVNTFSSYHLPHRGHPREDLDMASYGIVKVLENARGIAYPEMTWEPKVAFTALGECYRPGAGSI